MKVMVAGAPVSAGTVLPDPAFVPAPHAVRVSPAASRTDVATIRRWPPLYVGLVFRVTLFSYRW
jgi:hypothetical protein